MQRKPKKQEQHSEMQSELEEAEAIEEEEEVVVKQEVDSWVTARESSEMLLPVVLSRLVKSLPMLGSAGKGELWAEASVVEEVVVVILADLGAVEAVEAEALASRAKEEAHHTATSTSKTVATFPQIWTKQTKDHARISTSSTFSATMSKTRQPQMPTWLPSASIASNTANEKSQLLQTLQSQRQQLPHPQAL